MSDYAAIKIGLTPNKSRRYRLNKEQLDKFLKLSKEDIKSNQYDNDNTLGVLSAINPHTGKYMGIWDFCEYYNINKDYVKSFKAVNSQNGGIPTYNITSTEMKGEYFEEFYEKLIKDIENIDTRPKTIKRSGRSDNGNLLVLSPADVHIGKLCDSFETGEDYNSQIAVQRVKEGVEGVIEKSKGFNIDKTLFVVGNDILHIDTPSRTTSGGTPQDTDGSWYSNFLMAKQLYIEVILRVARLSDVHVVFNPSNHDYMSGFFLADVIKTYFKDMKNVTFDVDVTHRKYFKYYNNLLGTTHGDGAKQGDLPLLMADECKYWSECKHRYIYSHHVHHKISKDYIGVTFESLRSPSGADGWHSKKGYKGVPKAIEGFIHDKEHGQIARITHIF